MSETPKAPAIPEDGPPFVFDRYVNGTLMAEGVEVERAKTLMEAAAIAARIAARGPNGEAPVLVHVARRPAPAVPEDVAPGSMEAAILAVSRPAGAPLWLAYCDKKMELEDANDRIAQLEAEVERLRLLTQSGKQSS